MSQSSAAAADLAYFASAPEQADVEMVFVPVFQGDDDLGDLAGVDAAAGGEIARARASGEFRGKPYEFFITPVRDHRWKCARIALVGAGSREDLDVERLRRIAAACSYTAALRSISSVAFVVRSNLDSAIAVQAAADGLTAAEFDAGAYKRRSEVEGRYPKRLMVALTSAQADQRRLDEAVNRGFTIGRSANLARQLANEPGNVLTPRGFAARVEAAATSTGLSVEVLDEERIRALGMGLLLAVSQGSAEPPRLVVIRYDPPGAADERVLGFVGKGITFDSGGISIKPADGMDRMKDDMSGGAAVTAAMCAIARLKGTHRIIGVIPMSENMPERQDRRDDQHGCRRAPRARRRAVVRAEARRNPSRGRRDAHRRLHGRARTNGLRIVWRARRLGRHGPECRGTRGRSRLAAAAVS